MQISKILSLIAMLIIVSSGCKKDEEDANVSISSRHNETESHNTGQACQSCHASGGSGQGWFGIAGSVYAQDLSAVSPNGNIYLYTGPAGTGSLVVTIEVDGKGNFFTTAFSIPATGVYPQVKGASGNIKNMAQLCVSGNCNSCHGVSTAKIWVN